MIHQWHDDFPAGLTWKGYKRGTFPPVVLFIQANENGDNKLVYNYGLKDKVKDLKRVLHMIVC